MANVKVYPNLKINISSNSKKRKVSFLSTTDEDDSVPPIGNQQNKSYDGLSLRITYTIPPNEDNEPPRKKRKILQNDEESDDKKADVGDENHHKHGDDDDSVEYEEDADDDASDIVERSDTIVEAIKLIQQQQTQSIGLFEKLLKGSTNKKKAKKNVKPKKKTKNKKTKSSIDSKSNAAKREQQRKQKIEYIEPTKSNNVRFKVTIS